MTEHITIGIDIAKDTFDVFISPDGLFLHLENTPHGHQQLLDALASRAVTRIVMEATGPTIIFLLPRLSLPVCRSLWSTLLRSNTSHALSGRCSRPTRMMPASSASLAAG